MKARLPLRMNIKVVRTTSEGGPVECDYDILDADDNVVVSDQFTTAAGNVTEVSAYTVERLSAMFAAPVGAHTMSDAAKTTLDQVLSPVGVTKGSSVKKAVSQ